MGRRQWRWALITPAAAVLLAAAGAPALASTAHPAGHAAARAGSASTDDHAWQKKYLHPGGALYCGGIAAANCVDINGRTAASAGHTPWYVGHDEPSALFYSNQAGSGNNSSYLLRLPRDPQLQPNNSGTGGVWNFQQHPAFWFGMAMCDTQSFPEFNNSTCPRDSDSNIFASTDPSSPKFIGRHTGAAYMEMQFYPPGWAPWPAGVSCDPTQWCAALTIDSFNSSSAGVNNNAACLNTVGVEPVNFAFITKTGMPQAPPDPTKATLATFTPNKAKDLFMNPGDLISVSLGDTGSGFRVMLHDRTTHQSGFMTASARNGFGQVLYQPGSSSCNSAPYSFHPMYSTSGPNTRVVWAAHSYNVAFSDEIGHFEYCNAVDTSTGSCTAAGVTESNGQLDNDDFGCFAGSQSLLVNVNGCIATDGDFDGPEYSAAGWAPSPNTPQPIAFTSPTFNKGQQYSQAAFENDLPRIEDPSVSPNNNCNRSTGAGCVNPPAGASFYPIFSTTRSVLNGACTWQEGGGNIPGTINNFGGTSKAEYGQLLKLDYPTSPTTFTTRFNDFRQVLSTNPC